MGHQEPCLLYTSKQIEIANRIVMPPMAIYIPGSKGYVEQRLIDYYEERAKSQPGMIIINATSINLTSARSCLLYTSRCV